MAGSGEHVLTDGASITRPPAFNGQKFSFWQMKFQNFILDTHTDLWDVFERGDYVPMKVEDGLTPKTRTESAWIRCCHHSSFFFETLECWTILNTNLTLEAEHLGVR